MREVTVYYAYDDSEFEDRDECLRYERQAVEAMMSVNDCYDFLDKDGVCYTAPDYRCEDVEEWMDWLSDAAQHCDYVNVRYVLPENAVRFIDREWGYCIAPEDFHNETGLFKYDDFKNEWVKVGE
jgi:hypothetical protein